MDAIHGWLFVGFLALALIIILLATIKGWRLYKKYRQLLKIALQVICGIFLRRFLLSFD